MRTASIDAFVARKKSTPVLKLASRKFPFCGGAGVASRDQTCPNEKLLPPRVGVRHHHVVPHLQQREGQRRLAQAHRPEGDVVLPKVPAAELLHLDVLHACGRGGRRLSEAGGSAARQPRASPLSRRRSRGEVIARERGRRGGRRTGADHVLRRHAQEPVVVGWVRREALPLAEVERGRVERPDEEPGGVRGEVRAPSQQPLGGPRRGRRAERRHTRERAGREGSARLVTFARRAKTTQLRRRL